MQILVINSGSATLKFKLFDAKTLKETLGGIVERIGLKGSFLIIGKKKFNYSKGIKNHSEALKIIFYQLPITNYQLLSIGHRVVHGGEKFTKPTVINANVLKQLKQYNKLAPLHNPINIAGIEACRKLLPGVRNVAVFDTAFYKTIPDYAYIYSLPIGLYKKYGIRKYGFHGINHEYVVQEAAKRLGKPLGKLRIISCHLGSGSSITATRFGRAIDTSMGFTPLEGLTMATRCGDIDSAIPLYLIKNLKMSVNQVDDLMNKKSGLLGLTGTPDMREVIARAKKGNRAARLAIEIFVYDVVRYIGSYAMILGGIDALVFTGGIGERSEVVRGLVLKSLKSLGKFKTLVVKANEELMIAREVGKPLRWASEGPAGGGD